MFLLKKIAVVIGIIIMVCIVGEERLSYGSDVNQKKEGGNVNEDLSNYDFTEIEKALDNDDIDFTELVKKLATGQSEGVFYELFKSIINKLFGDLAYNKGAIVKIIVIAVISSLFTNMSIVLKKTEMSETGFYVTYMLLITVLTGGFVVMAEVVVSALNTVVTFMNALIPAFFLSVGISTGSVSAIGFSQIVLIAIALIEKIILRFIIPMVNVYVVILLVNNIVSEDYFSKFAGVLKTFILWSLKGFVTLLMGANIIQGIILPSVDGAKTGIVNKIINIIPGGTAITSVEGILTTTGMVIKNAIGGAGLIAIGVICIFPLFKMLVYIAMYKITGAIIQPISDKRIGKSIDAVSDGIHLLYRITLTVVFLFFITIALVCLTTNIKG